MRLNAHAIFGWFAANRASQEMRRIMMSVGILNFAVGSITLFEPIYLYNLGYALRDILIFYGAMYFIYVIILPFGSWLTRHWGLHHAMLYSGPFLIAYYLLLMGAGGHPWFLFLAVPVLAIQKTLYWPNYHSAIAESGSGAERGRELSELYLLMEIVAVFGPIFGGLVITGLGFPSLFAIASVLILISYMPLMTIPERQDGDGFSAANVWKKIFDPSRWRQTVAWFAYGEELLGMTIWPIFVFLAAGGFVQTGTAISASLVVVMALTLIAGRYIDRKNHELTRLGGLLTVAAWLVKPFARTVGAIFGADAFYRLSRTSLDMPVFASLYARAKEGSVREEVVVMEMCYTGGKLFIAVIGIVILSFTSASFTALFMLGAAFSMLNLLR